MRVQKIFLVVFAVMIFIAIGGGIWVGKEEPLFIRLLLAFIFAFGPTIIFFIGLSRFRRERIRKEPAKARRIRRMRNGLGVLHIYFKALLYSYLLLFVLVFVAVIAGVSSSIIGQASPPEEGVWWFPIIAVFVALLSYGLLFYFTRRRKFGTIFRDVFNKPTKLTGQVSSTWSKTTSGLYTTTEHFITVRGESFPVFSKIHDWLSQGDEVVVHYWPRSKTVSKVERLSA